MKKTLFLYAREANLFLGYIEKYLAGLDLGANHFSYAVFTQVMQCHSTNAICFQRRDPKYVYYKLTLNRDVTCSEKFTREIEKRHLLGQSRCHVAPRRSSVNGS